MLWKKVIGKRSKFNFKIDEFIKFNENKYINK